jgi:stearoyl-CoA desaturase (Delta-9 desaturase)
MPSASSIPATTRIRPARLRRDRVIFGAAIGLPAAGSVAAFASLPQLGFTTLDLVLFAGFYVLTVVGIEVGYHRLFSHSAFVAHPALRAALAVAGAMAMQGTVV